MSEQQGKLEITLSRIENLRESHITGEIATSSPESQQHYHSRPWPLYQANLKNSATFYSWIRELLAIEATRHLAADTQAKEIHVKADSSFLTPDGGFLEDLLYQELNIFLICMALFMMLL